MKKPTSSAPIFRTIFRAAIAALLILIGFAVGNTRPTAAPETITIHHYHTATAAPITATPTATAAPTSAPPIINNAPYNANAGTPQMVVLRGINDPNQITSLGYTFLDRNGRVVSQSICHNTDSCTWLAPAVPNNVEFYITYRSEKGQQYFLANPENQVTVIETDFIVEEILP